MEGMEVRRNSHPRVLQNQGKGIQILELIGNSDL